MVSLCQKKDGAEERNEQFSRRPAQNHDGVTEPAKEKVSAFVNEQVGVIEEKESRPVCEGIKQKQDIRTEPGNAYAARPASNLRICWLEEPFLRAWQAPENERSTS